MARVHRRINLFLLPRHNVEVGESNKANQDVAFFTVRGMSLGTASLTFTASALGKGSATSAPRDIQVNHCVVHRDRSESRVKMTASA